MTLYVFAFVVVMALFLWLTDKTLEWVLYEPDSGLEAVIPGIHNTRLNPLSDVQSHRHHRRRCAGTWCTPTPAWRRP
jgi:hypothetical protein